ncbi:MAG: hypothetical protein M1498_02020 [Candidatus Thermoplasmatota archaeon]|nr:hypothetical protein [Candidatus Thermoplasmatota archaeon]
MFGRYRKPERKNGMTRKEICKNVEKGREMIYNSELSDAIYNNSNTKKVKKR